MKQCAKVYKYSKEDYKFCHIHLHKKRAKTIRVQEDTTSCPHCKAETKYDENHNETYCTKCGLIVSASIEYVGLRKAFYEYGRN